MQDMRKTDYNYNITVEVNYNFTKVNEKKQS